MEVYKLKIIITKIKNWIDELKSRMKEIEEIIELEDRTIIQSEKQRENRLKKLIESQWTMEL